MTKNKPALPKIKMLKNITISPMEKPVRLSRIMATISVSSKEPPYLMIRPTPIPRTIPNSTLKI